MTTAECQQKAKELRKKVGYKLPIIPLFGPGSRTIISCLILRVELSRQMLANLAGANDEITSK